MSTTNDRGLEGGHAGDPRGPAGGVAVRRLGPDDRAWLPAAEAVFAEGIGVGYLTVDLLEALLDPPHPVEVLVGAFVGGQLVGAATTSAVTAEQADQIVERGARVGVAAPRFDPASTGKLHTSSVAPSARRQGLGRMLVDARLELLADAGCTDVISLSWVSGSRDSSASVLEAAGFERCCVIERYWFDDSSDEGGYACPRCGHACTCSAIVYRRALTSH